VSTLSRACTQMLCGLLRAIHFLQLNWQQLAKDIAFGILNLRVSDPSIREFISKILKPNHELAEFHYQGMRKPELGRDYY